jgi:preprotein translocase subunit SecA
VAWQESHDQVLEAGGLHVIGTERHESRRIDNQLRGRAGRQGDPGYSRFYLSLEDDLMRIFASDRVRGFMQNMGMENGEAIEHKMVTNAIEKAQRKVEGRNFDIRKQLLEYDDVANDQRQMIYGQRNELIESEEISHIVDALWDDVIDEVIDGYIPPQSLEEQWDVPGLESACHTEFNVKLPVQNWLDEDSSLFEDTLRQRIVGEIRAEYVKKEALVGPQLRMFEKRIMLDILDGLWKEHLAAMDYLRKGIHLRAYAQKKPKDEYKREAFELFDNLLKSVRFDVIRFLSRVQFQTEEDAEALELRRREEESRVQRNYQKDDSPGMGGSVTRAPVDELNEPFVRRDKKVGRNEPCPCGSGKKYKACHGKLG